MNKRQKQHIILFLWITGLLHQTRQK